jgi:abhydrolase domain-containing protein 14
MGKGGSTAAFITPRNRSWVMSLGLGILVSCIVVFYLLGLSSVTSRAIGGSPEDEKMPLSKPVPAHAMGETMPLSNLVPAVNSAEETCSSETTSSCTLKSEIGNQAVGSASVYFVRTTCDNSVAVNSQRPWVLFLHGAAFSVEEWIKIDSLQLTAKQGFNNVAVDMPGFGKSGAAKTDQASFLKDLVAAFGMKQVIVVSPSMSGRFSVPYLMRNEPELVGYVAVAPGYTETFKNTEYQSIKTPTLIIIGEKDTGLGFTAIEHLSNLAAQRKHMVPNAGHPSYNDNPADFHQQLFHFFKCEFCDAKFCIANIEHAAR